MPVNISKFFILVIIGLWSLCDISEAAKPENNLKEAQRLTELSEFDKAISILDCIIKTSPNLSDAYWFRAINYSNKGLFDHALKDSKTYCRLEPDCADGLVWQAWILTQAGKYQDAVEAATKALDLSPDNNEALEERVNANLYLGNYVQVESDCTLLIERGHDVLQSRSWRAYSSLGLRKYDAVIKDCELVLKEKPDSKEALTYLIEAFRLTGQCDGSRSLADKLVKLYPEDPVVYGMRAQIIMSQGKKWSEAVGDLEKTLTLTKDPSLVSLSQFYLSLIYLIDEDLSKALHYVDLAINTMPGIPKFHYQRGLILKKQKQFEKAEKDFKKADTLSRKLLCSSSASPKRVFTANIFLLDENDAELLKKMNLKDKDFREFLDRATEISKKEISRIPPEVEEGDEDRPIKN